VPLLGGAPAVFQTVQDLLAGLALDGSSVYWTYTDSMNRGFAAKVGLGGGMPTTLASNLSFPYGMRIDANNAYWTDFDGTVDKVGLGGAGFATLATSSGAFAVALDSTYVYWTDYFNKPGGSIQRAPIAGGPAFTLASGLDSPVDLAVDGSCVYFIESNGAAVMKVGK